MAERERTMPRAYVSPISLVIPRATGVAITLFKGKFHCRNAKQARDIVHSALTIGVSIDRKADFAGNWHTFCSSDGVDFLRAKHNWHAPKVSRPPRGKTKAVPVRYVPRGDYFDKLFPDKEKAQ